MWSNHVATWAYANDSARNFDLRFCFRICIIFCNIVFGLHLTLKKLNHFTGIWKRLNVTVWGPLPWSRYAITTFNYDKVSIYCVLLTPQWKQILRSTSMQVKETWSLKYSIVRLDMLNRKFPRILIITEAQMLIFFVWTKWVCPPRTRRFCENDSDSSFESLTVTRVESFCEKRDLSRVTFFLNVTRIESELTKIATWVDSRHWLESPYHCLILALGELPV